MADDQRVGTIDYALSKWRPQWDYNTQGLKFTSATYLKQVYLLLGSQSGIPPSCLSKSLEIKDYRPVQELREVNKQVEIVHPIAPNTYTLFTLLPPGHKVYLPILNMF